MKIEVRRALPEDAAALSHIASSAKAYWGYPEHWMETWKPQLTFPPDYFSENESWIAELENIPIAFYTLQEKNGIAWIENLWVLPEHIGKGIGRQLFLHALSRSREMGYLIIQLEADPNALGFYQKMGMYKIGEKKYMVEDKERLLPVMEMVIDREQ